jgi:hypothetical protein
MPKIFYKKVGIIAQKDINRYVIKNSKYS